MQRQFNYTNITSQDHQHDNELVEQVVPGPGVCYRLYSEDDYYEMSEYTVPEILRGSIDDSLLVFYLFQSMEIIPSTLITFQQFPLLQYPSDQTIHLAVKRLQYYGAITSASTPLITSLGVLLSYLPLPIQQGYFLVLSAFLNQPYLGVLLCSTLSFQVCHSSNVQK